MQECISMNKESRITTDNKIKFSLQTFLVNPYDAYHVAHTTISSSDDLSLHDHDYAEVFWIKEGHGIHRVNGHDILLKQGSLVMIRPSDQHTFNVETSKSSLVITNIAFDKSNLDYFRKRYFPDSDSFFWTRGPLPFITQLTPEQLNELSTMANKLFNQPKDHLTLDHVMLHIFNIFHQLNSNQSQLPHWLSFAIEKYHSPLHFRNGLDGFVAICNRGKDHVNRTLQKYLKQSLSETVNKMKISYAAQQLIMTNSPIKTICAECGYNNITYFYRLFKKFYGLSPAEYRAKNHKIF